MQVFNYTDTLGVRTVKNNGEIWFVLKDVCDILELSNPTRVAERLDDDELTLLKVRSGDQNREVNAVNEPGLYNVIFSSNKPEAKAFKRWVTHEVLPSIRKTGEYKSKNAVQMTDSERIRLSNHYLKLAKIESLGAYGKNKHDYVRKAIEIMDEV
jgi:prophage antirepressor-like protein